MTREGLQLCIKEREREVGKEVVSGKKREISGNREPLVNVNVFAFLGSFFKEGKSNEKDEGSTDMIIFKRKRTFYQKYNSCRD